MVDNQYYYNGNLDHPAEDCAMGIHQLFWNEGSTMYAFLLSMNISCCSRLNQVNFDLMTFFLFSLLSALWLHIIILLRLIAYFYWFGCNNSPMARLTPDQKVRSSRLSVVIKKLFYLKKREKKANKSPLLLHQYPN